MIAVIFEVWPNEGKRDEYLALAASLREELMTMDGFLSIDRFESLYDQGRRHAVRHRNQRDIRYGEACCAT